VQATLIVIILVCSAVIVICAARAIWKRLSTAEHPFAPSLAVQPL
jgi:hypothetical protein